VLWSSVAMAFLLWMNRVYMGAVVIAAAFFVVVRRAVLDRYDAL